MSKEAGIFFRRAIVREIGDNFAAGLTTSGLGAPDIALARAQHGDYCRALRECGLELTVLPAELAFADAPFIEDTAVLTADFAIITRPGATSRSGEVESVRAFLKKCFRQLFAIESPGTLEGGDICQAGKIFLIGVTKRSNEKGARQLAAILNSAGYECRLVPLGQESDPLHLKSGIAYLGEGRLAVIRPWLQRPEFAGFELLPVEVAEAYGANCLRVNGTLLLAKGHPRLQSALVAQGFKVRLLDMSEFRKMDGGLSCLSLRY